MEETLLSRRLVAVWFADIVGYRARSAEDETGALRLVEILQTLSRGTVRRYGDAWSNFLATRSWRNFQAPIWQFAPPWP